MSKFHSRDESVTQDNMEPMVQLWLLRLLIRLESFRKSYCKMRRHYSEDELIYSLSEIFAVDMEYCKTEDDDIDYKKVLKHLDKLYINSEKTQKHATAPMCLARNVQRLSALAGLSATDCRILEFAILIHTEETLKKTADLLGDLTSIQVFNVLSMLLDLPQAEVRKSLSKNGALSKSGLLSLNKGVLVADSLDDKLGLLSPHFADNISENGVRSHNAHGLVMQWVGLSLLKLRAFIAG